jgi:hypothetical protein
MVGGDPVQFDRFGDVDRDHQDHDGEHDVHGEQEVEQQGRHGRDERHDDGQDGERDDQFAQVEGGQERGQAFGLALDRVRDCCKGCSAMF